MTYLAAGLALLAAYSVLWYHDWLARRRNRERMERLEEANERTMNLRLRVTRLICEEKEDTQRRICRRMERMAERLERKDWDTDDFDDWDMGSVQ